MTGSVGTQNKATLPALRCGRTCGIELFGQLTEVEESLVTGPGSRSGRDEEPDQTDSAAVRPG